jgi:RNA polymerase sigma-70 factor (ECF subfamily)
MKMWSEKKYEMSDNGGAEFGEVVKPLRFSGDDNALVNALKAKHPGAMETLYDRYGSHVQKVLVRVLGFDAELSDILHEVFIEAFSNVDSIRDGTRLRAWITTIAIFTARQRIRRRSRRRVFWVHDETIVRDVCSKSTSPEEREALKLTYKILDAMPMDERIPFALRFIEGMDLGEVAESCDVSISTVKRRINRAETRFTAIARRYPVLREWIERGDRWRGEK